jgi:Lysylphosphatidylglycerol synthase TM region
VKRAIAIGSTAVGVAAFAYALSVNGVTTIQQAIARVGWGFAAILLLSGVRETAKAAAWAQTFTGSYRLPLVDALRARLAGEALSTLLPMGVVVGEPTKAQYVGDRMPFATAFSGLVLEFAFYSASLTLFAIAALILFVPNKAAVLVAALAGLAILLVVRPVQRAVAPVRRFVIERPRRACAVGALEIVYHALGLAETYLILRFLNPAGATWTAAVAFETLSRGVSIAFKMVPMRVGVDEASAAFMATRLAIAPSTGVMLALVRKLRVLFWTALGLLEIAVRTFQTVRAGTHVQHRPAAKISLKTRLSTARSLPSLPA